MRSIDEIKKEMDDCKRIMRVMDISNAKTPAYNYCNIRYQTLLWVLNEKEN